MNGVGDVVRIDGRLTAEKYVHILEDFFLPSLRERDFHANPGQIIFVQDKSPIHMARIVKETSTPWKMSGGIWSVHGIQPGNAIHRPLWLT